MHHTHDGESICAYVGRRRKVESAEMLEKDARERVPLEIVAGGNLGMELAYENHRSVLKYRREGLKKAVKYVAIGSDASTRSRGS